MKQLHADSAPQAGDEDVRIMVRKAATRRELPQACSLKQAPNAPLETYFDGRVVHLALATTRLR
jgi:hypothetical protein